MPRKRVYKPKAKQEPKKVSSDHIQRVDVVRHFHLEFLNSAQELAWQAYQTHDILFMNGPAGTGKTFLATGFGIFDIISKSKKKLVLCRPVVESGESLGYLPGELDEKVRPYMLPIYDCFEKICGSSSMDLEIVKKSVEVCPIAYIRGRSFEDSVIILDEAQNCTKKQLKLVLTRLGVNSKMIITGDPTQSDLPSSESGLEDLMARLNTIQGIGKMTFRENAIVRHPLVAKILKKIEDY